MCVCVARRARAHDLTLSERSRAALRLLAPPTMAAVREADALRADMAACLRALSGEGEPDRPGVEALVSAFIDRASSLQRQFAANAMREADDIANTDELRADVEALRREIAEKEALLTAHRANTLRWREECLAVQQSTTCAAQPQLDDGS